MTAPAVAAIQGRSYQIEAILFDKDGTLLDFASLWLSWLDALLDDLTRNVTVPVSRSDLASAVGADLSGRFHDTDGPLAVGTNSEVRLVLAQRLYASGLRWEEARFAVEKANSTVDATLSEAPLIGPVAGVVDFVATAKELGLATGVVTADDSDRTKRHLAMLGLHDRLDVVVGADTVRNGKPDPEGVLLACELLKVRPSHTLLVGDTASDMEAAVAAGLAVGLRLHDLPAEQEASRSSSGATPLHRIQGFDEVRLTAAERGPHGRT